MDLNKLFHKDTLFKVHGWVGIKLSILFFIVCFSGTLAVFSHEMDWSFNPDMRATPRDTYGSRNLAVKNILAIFPEGEITYWERAREPYLTDIVYVKYPGGRKYVFVNPYTATVQGSADLTIQRFFRDLHYFLFIPDQVGNYLVLFFGLVLVVSLVTGMLYYKDWYKKLFVLKTIGAENVDCHDISKSSKDSFSNYNFLIIGLSTWHDGQPQSDWDTFYEEFKTIDFTGKTVAFFGLGDQVGYSEYFIDGIGILAEVVYTNGGEIVGVWPTDGYNFEASKAVFEEGWFVGLAIDEDNQSHLTMDRIRVWLEQIAQDAKIKHMAADFLQGIK